MTKYREDLWKLVLDVSEKTKISRSDAAFVIKGYLDCGKSIQQIRKEIL